jgi:CheY-like chemotaxis protein
MSTILVIEDQNDVRAALAGVLQGAGFDVREASNGLDGIASIEESLPDLIITDIFMPVSDGLEIIRLVRKLDMQLPIIAISGGTPVVGLDYLPIARNLGATAGLIKPITPNDLLSAVSRLLTGSEMLAGSSVRGACAGADQRGDGV